MSEECIPYKYIYSNGKIIDENNSLLKSKLFKYYETTDNIIIRDIIFENLHLEIIKILIKYRIDLSNYKPKNLLNDIETIGMD